MTGSYSFILNRTSALSLKNLHSQESSYNSRFSEINWKTFLCKKVALAIIFKLSYVAFCKNIHFKGKIALCFWCPLFHVFKIIKMESLWNPDSVFSFALKSGRESQDYRIFIILEPDFYLCSDHTKKSSLSKVLPKKSGWVMVRMSLKDVWRAKKPTLKRSTNVWS